MDEGVSSNQGFRDLVVWQRGMELVTEIYKASRSWPKDEQFGLTAQLRRAAVSVPSNIAEGNGRSGVNEFRHHLSVAFGSLCEVETQLLVAEQLTYLDSSSAAQLLERVANVRRPLL